MINKIKTARVHWKDIATISDDGMAWFTEQEAKDTGKKFYDHDHLTIGEILEDNKEFILIASTINRNSKCPIFSDISMIPKSVITKIDYIK